MAFLYPEPAFLLVCTENINVSNCAKQFSDRPQSLKQIQCLTSVFAKYRDLLASRRSTNHRPSTTNKSRYFVQSLSIIVKCKTNKKKKKRIVLKTEITFKKKQTKDIVKFTYVY